MKVEEAILYLLAERSKVATIIDDEAAWDVRDTGFVQTGYMDWDAISTF